MTDLTEAPCPLSSPRSSLVGKTALFPQQPQPLVSIYLAERWFASCYVACSRSQNLRYHEGCRDHQQFLLLASIY